MISDSVRFQICGRKVRYRKAEARSMVRQMRANLGPLRTLTLRAYKCVVCRYWHLGRHKFDPHVVPPPKQDSRQRRVRRKALLRQLREAR